MAARIASWEDAPWHPTGVGLRCRTRGILDPIVYLSSTTDAFSWSIAMRPSGTVYATWHDIGDAIYGIRYDPVSHGWGEQQTLTTSGTWYTPAVSIIATDAIVVAAYYNTTYDIRALKVAVL